MAVTHIRWLWKNLSRFLPAARAAVARGTVLIDYAVEMAGRHPGVNPQFALEAYVYATMDAARADAARLGVKRPWSWSVLWADSRVTLAHKQLEVILSRTMQGHSREAKEAQARSFLFRIYNLFAVRANSTHR